MNDAKQHIELHLPITSEATDHPPNMGELNAVTHLSLCSKLSKQQIKQAMFKGAVWLTRGKQTQRLRRAKKILLPGDTLHLYYDEKIISEKPQAAILVADVNAYSLWYKPYGMYCQGSKWADHCTINRWIEQNTQRPAYIVHRLDRAATGLLIISHEKKCTGALASLFQQRRLKKCYRAIVHGQFPTSDMPKTLNEPIEGREAISHVQLINYFDQADQSLVEINIETGRKHQIRRHLSGIGHPIVGERMYSTHNDSDDLQLCSWSLTFTCPLHNKPVYYDLLGSPIPQINQYRGTH
jgi:23S rRNA-/tRNA-specific pseudouridylate synthase